MLGYKDYWIIQGSSEKTYLEDLPLGSEKYGVGVNTYSYWAATNILGTWFELPLVTAELVASSRNFKYIFTGNLEEGIKRGGFVGKEKELVILMVFSSNASWPESPIVANLPPRDSTKPTKRPLL